MARKDFKTVDGDLYIDPTTGDLVIEDSNEQHIQDIISAYPGHYKETPQIGAGITRFLNASGAQERMRREIKIHLEMDGYTGITFNGPSVNADEQ